MRPSYLKANVPSLDLIPRKDWADAKPPPIYNNTEMQGGGWTQLIWGWRQLALRNIPESDADHSMGMLNKSTGESQEKTRKIRF